METIWAHNPSEKELKRLFDTTDREEIEAYISTRDSSHYSAIIDLYFLRKKYNVVEKYLKKIGMSWDEYIANAHFDELILEE